MKLLIPLISLFVLVSCSRNTEMIRVPNSKTLVLRSDEIGFDHAKGVDWRVGRQKNNKETISKGIRARAVLPELSSGDMTEFLEVSKADSWVVRLKKKHGVQSDYIEYFLVPLSYSRTLRKGAKSKAKAKSVRVIGLNLYYAAAAVSSRLRSLKCPAFDHKYLVTDHEIRDGGKFELRSSGVFDASLNARVKVLELGAYIVNIGMSLEGIYSLELALYNSKTKRRKSQWAPLPKKLVVSREKRVPLPQCKGFSVPSRNSRTR